MIKNSPVLVLNKSWLAIGVVALEDAIVKLASFYKDGTPKARIVDCVNDFRSFEWSDWTKIKPKEDEKSIKGVNAIFRVPEIIQFTRYDRVPHRQIHYNRRNIFLRDNNQCQYCSSKKDLTLDHILPRSRNGKSSWENIVVACVKCNLKKADRTPQEAGMKLLKKPVKPKYNFSVGDIKIKSWTNFVSEIYWNTELESD